jgi:L-rhamnose mutarotase
MERLCFLMNLIPGREAEYERRHDEIWPEMRDAVSAAGFTNYGLFRRGSTVIGYAECVPDIASVLATIAASDVNARWAESFADIIESMTDESGDLIRFAEVWHLP